VKGPSNRRSSWDSQFEASSDIKLSYEGRVRFSCGLKYIREAKKQAWSHDHWSFWGATRMRRLRCRKRKG